MKNLANETALNVNEVNKNVDYKLGDTNYKAVKKYCITVMQKVHNADENKVHKVAEMRKVHKVYYIEHNIVKTVYDDNKVKHSKFFVSACDTSILFKKLILMLWNWMIK